MYRCARWIHFFFFLSNTIGTSVFVQIRSVHLSMAYRFSKIILSPTGLDEKMRNFGPVTTEVCINFSVDQMVIQRILRHHIRSKSSGTFRTNEKNSFFFTSKHMVDRLWRHLWHTNLLTVIVELITFIIFRRWIESNQ